MSCRVGSMRSMMSSLRLILAKRRVAHRKTACYWWQINVLLTALGHLSFVGTKIENVKMTV